MQNPCCLTVKGECPQRQTGRSVLGDQDQIWVYKPLAFSLLYGLNIKPSSNFSKLTLSPASVQQTVSKWPQSWHGCPFQLWSPFIPVSEHNIVPKFTPSLWQFVGCIPIRVIFTICTSPPGKFHFQHPPIPPSPQVKWVSGDCRRENCLVCAERHLL